MDFPVLFNNMCVSRQDCGGAGDRIGNWVTANYDGSSLTWKNLSSRHFQYKGSQVEKYLHIVSSFLKKVEISNIVEKYGSEWSKMHEKTQELSLHNVTPPQSVPNTSLMKSSQKYEQLWEIWTIMRDPSFKETFFGMSPETLMLLKAYIWRKRHLGTSRERSTFGN